MDLLPAQLEVPSAPLERKHVPQAGEWKTFRPCLRIDFDYTCAFCRCHEADLVELGAQGTGLFAIEHFYPRAKFQSLENNYDNCFYICRYCNGPRNAKPNVAKDGRELLNPCDEAWSEHFEYVSDEYRLVPKNPDAEYTDECYKLNTPRKVKSREHRFQVISERAETILSAPARVKALRDLMLKLTGEDRKTILAQLLRERRAIQGARQDLERYLKVPADAPLTCNC